MPREPYLEQHGLVVDVLWNPENRCRLLLGMAPDSSQEAPRHCLTIWVPAVVVDQIAIMGGLGSWSSEVRMMSAVQITFTMWVNLEYVSTGSIEPPEVRQEVLRQLNVARSKEETTGTHPYACA